MKRKLNDLDKIALSGLLIPIGAIVFGSFEGVIRLIALVVAAIGIGIMLYAIVPKKGERL